MHKHNFTKREAELLARLNTLRQEAETIRSDAYKNNADSDFDDGYSEGMESVINAITEYFFPGYQLLEVEDSDGENIVILKAIGV